MILDTEAELLRRLVAAVNAWRGGPDGKSALFSAALEIVDSGAAERILARHRLARTNYLAETIDILVERAEKAEAAVRDPARCVLARNHPRIVLEGLARCEGCGFVGTAAPAGVPEAEDTDAVAAEILPEIDLEGISF